ncbi:MAG: threonine--tRNA ligase [Firmicutes bacterium]|nr:threonine--tRNA ligase [Bacillota bacterium]
MKITLKDGKVLEYKKPLSVREIAKQISEGLARIAIGGKVDGTLVGLDFVLEKNCSLQIVTTKDVEYTEMFRHTAAHCLAHGIKKVYPNAKFGVGPATDNGFYYDVEFDTPIGADDLAKIEKAIQSVVDANHPIVREVIKKTEALKLFEKANQPYKVELLNGLPKDETITIYKQGDFFDLCRGPHLESTGKIKYFKLTQITGAYWKGDQSNKMLTRIYGVAFEKKSELDEYLQRLEDAKNRDHAKLGRELGIFMTEESIGQGLPLFAPKGAKVMQTLIRWVEDEEAKRGYVLTRTPIIAKSDLYKISGHWEHYRDGMFVLGNNESNYMALRPMTCPFQFAIYNQGTKSYRDLPIRYAETSSLFRNENSGEMHGLIRVRQFTLSDGHIVCTPSQVEAEFDKCLGLTNYLLQALGLEGDVTYRFSKHDPANKEKYIDNPKMWASAEKELKQILDKHKLQYQESVGDAAFYGPKLDIQIKNVWGKEDTIITIQVDMALADRFDMSYIDENGTKQRPMIIHRSSLGCYERTLALLIEKYNGALPLWLAPTQVKVLSLTDRTVTQAEQITADLLAKGVSAEADVRGEKLGYKIREAQLQKIPYMLVVGDKEAESGCVAVRTRKGGDLGVMPYATFEQTVLAQIVDKTKEI